MKHPYRLGSPSRPLGTRDFSSCAGRLCAPAHPRVSAQRGISLVELALSLAVTGAVGFLLWGILPQSLLKKEHVSLLQKAQDAENALIGFAQRQHRLPCPAADDSGREHCSGATTRGRLPWRDLGLSADYAALTYGVGSSLLLQASTSLVPNLPPAPSGASVAGYSATALANGLDLCHGLRNLTALGGGASIGGVPYAWALAHPGANGQLDGANASGFALPGTPASTVPVYDDHVSAQTPAELAARLGCPQRLAQAHGSARAAYASYDLWRSTDAFAQFRAFAHQVRQTNVTYAGINLALAVVDVANAVGTGITGFAQTLAVSPTTAAIVADVGTLVVATGVAIGAAGAAGYSLATAITAEQKANAQKLAAAQEVTRAAAARVLAYTQAVQADQKGGRP